MANELTTPSNVSEIVLTTFAVTVAVVVPLASTFSDASYSVTAKVSLPSGAATSTVHVVAGAAHGALVVTPLTVTAALAVPAETYCGVRAVADALRGTAMTTVTLALEPDAPPLTGAPAGAGEPPPPPHAASSAHASASAVRFIGPPPASA
jgi:hypothetical protein